MLASLLSLAGLLAVPLLYALARAGRPDRGPWPTGTTTWRPPAITPFAGRRR